MRFRPFLFLFLKRTSAVLTFWNCMTPSVSTSGTYFPRNGDVILQMIAIIVSTTETIVKWRGIACVQWKMPRNYLLCFTSLSLKGSDFFFRLFGSPSAFVLYRFRFPFLQGVSSSFCIMKWPRVLGLLPGWNANPSQALYHLQIFRFRCPYGKRTVFRKLWSKSVVFLNGPRRLLNLVL